MTPEEIKAQVWHQYARMPNIKASMSGQLTVLEHLITVLQQTLKYTSIKTFAWDVLQKGNKDVIYTIILFDTMLTNQEKHDLGNYFDGQLEVENTWLKEYGFIFNEDSDSKRVYVELKG